LIKLRGTKQWCQFLGGHPVYRSARYKQPLPALANSEDIHVIITRVKQ